MINEIGNRYGSLLVLEISKPPRKVVSKEIWFLCRCDCGNDVHVRGHCLRDGTTTSCGCRRSKTSTGHGGRFVDKTGRRFGNLTVIELHSFDNVGYANWLCQCGCGNIKVIQSGRLNDTKNGTKSCGCARTKPEGVAAFNAIYRRYVANAKSRGYVWNLTKEQVKQITKENCYYCGTSPSNVERKHRNGGYVYNGIDRVDNTIGYVFENCVPCCGMCNKRKMSSSLDEFKSWIISIYNHWIIK